MDVPEQVIGNNLPERDDNFCSRFFGLFSFRFHIAILHSEHLTIVLLVVAGKTTCMIQALFRRDQEYMNNLKHQGCDDGSKCPQMMVTASSVLAAAIKGNFNALCATDRSGKLEKNTSLQPDPVSQEQNAPTSDSSESSLLGRFDEIASDAYPLITTFDSFLRMLDRSLATPFFSPGEESKPHCARSSLVDFARFDLLYFPKLGDVTSNRRFKLDASTLFTEIMSVIKGSIDTLSFDSGPRHLERGQYLALAKSRHSNLSIEERDNIFTLFEAYESRKAVTREYDLADFVLHVHCQLLKAPRDFRKLYSVMVDEVQDLTPTQIAILPYVCDNLDGFFFAGDTAQTIAHGVGFRFETLKDIFYSRFVRESPIRSFRVPELWHLKQNYRTHSQVLRIANTVVKLLLCLFPNSIDKLEDETSIVQGPKPVFFSDTDDVISSLFERGDINHCEFGSDQVILVRDKEIQTKLRSKIGSKALVLTVLESKGMEFSDILIFNFFSSGGFGNMWRSILSALPVFDKSPECYIPKHPQFDQKLHWPLLSELKKLYVLLTRTKQNLFIFESDKQVREPIQFLWGHKEVQAVVIKAFDDDVKMILTQKSTPEQWCEKGREFRTRKNHELAQQCFGRGGDIVNERLSYVDVIYTTAQIQGNLADRRKLLYDAGLICQSPPLQNFLNAAKLFYEGQHWEKAAECYAQAQLWEDAGSCYEKCEQFQLAAEMYCRAGFVDKFARVCFSKDLYTYCLKGLDKLKSEVDAPSMESLANLQVECIKKGAVYHSLRAEDDEMMSFVMRFSKIEEQRAFLRLRDKFALLLVLEEHYDNFVDAAKLHESAADYMKASQKFEKAGSNLRAAQCLLKAVRISMLDDTFLPAPKSCVVNTSVQKHVKKGKSKTKKKATEKNEGSQDDVFSIHFKKAMNLATTSSTAYVCSKVETDRNNDVQTEISILKKHDSLTLNQYLELRNQVNRPTTPVRLRLMTLRCVLRNERNCGRENDLPNLCRLVLDLILACESICATMRQVRKFMPHIVVANHKAMEESLLSCFEMFEIVQFDGLRNKVYFPSDTHGIRRMWPRTGSTKTTVDLIEISLEDFTSKFLPFCESISEDARTFLLAKINDSSSHFSARLDTVLSIFPTLSANGMFSTLARDVEICFEDLMLPTLPSVADMKALASIRFEQRYLSFSSLLHSGGTVKCDSVARDMLLTDPCWDKLATIRSIIRCTVKDKSKADKMMTLCAAFQYQALARTQMQDSVRYFVRSLEQSHRFLCAVQMVALVSPVSLSDVDKLSPAVFLSLAERTSVSLLICAKQFKGLILPTTTAFDVLNRPNEAYARIVQDCHHHPLDVNEDTSVARACDIARSVLSTLSTDCMESWLGGSNLFPPHHYSVRAIFLIVTVVINLRPESKQRGEIIAKLAKTCQEKRIREILLALKQLDLLRFLKDLPSKSPSCVAGAVDKGKGSSPESAARGKEDQAREGGAGRLPPPAGGAPVMGGDVDTRRLPQESGQAGSGSPQPSGDSSNQKIQNYNGQTPPPLIIDRHPWEESSHYKRQTLPRGVDQRGNALPPPPGSKPEGGDAPRGANKRRSRGRKAAGKAGSTSAVVARSAAEAAEAEEEEAEAEEAEAEAEEEAAEAEAEAAETAEVEAAIGAAAAAAAAAAASASAAAAAAEELLSKFSRVCQATLNPLICVWADSAAARAEPQTATTQMDRYVAACTASAAPRQGVVLVPVAREKCGVTRDGAALPRRSGPLTRDGAALSCPSQALAPPPPRDKKRGDGRQAKGLSVDAAAFLPPAAECSSCTAVAGEAAAGGAAGSEAAAGLGPEASARQHTPTPPHTPGRPALSVLARHRARLVAWADRARGRVAARTAADALALRLASEFVGGLDAPGRPGGRGRAALFAALVAPLQLEVRAAILDADAILWSFREGKVRRGLAGYAAECGRRGRGATYTRKRGARFSLYPLCMPSRSKRAIDAAESETAANAGQRRRGPRQEVRRRAHTTVEMRARRNQGP